MLCGSFKYRWSGRHDMGIKERLINLLLIIAVLILPQGCGIDDSLIQEIENAYKQSGQSHVEKNRNVSTLIVHRYSKGSNVLVAIKDLQKHGFTIIENSYTGWRLWPDGEKTQYPEEIKLNLKIQKDQLNYLAERNYGWGILENRRAIISIESDGELILNTRAAIYIDTL
jgi:hypothetical protein